MRLRILTTLLYVILILPEQISGQEIGQENSMHGYDKKYKLKFKNLAERDHCVNTVLIIEYLLHCPFIFI